MKFSFVFKSRAKTAKKTGSLNSLRILRATIFVCLFCGGFVFAEKKIERQFTNAEIILNWGKKNSCSRELEPKGRMTCGLKPNVSEVTWFHVGNNEAGDMYLFFRKFPLGEKSVKSSSTNIVYSGKEMVVWKDEVQQLILRPIPSSYTPGSIAPEKK